MEKQAFVVENCENLNTSKITEKLFSWLQLPAILRIGPLKLIKNPRNPDIVPLNPNV